MNDPRNKCALSYGLDKQFADFLDGTKDVLQFGKNETIEFASTSHTPSP